MKMGTQRSPSGYTTLVEQLNVTLLGCMYQLTALCAQIARVGIPLRRLVNALALHASSG